MRAAGIALWRNHTGWASLGPFSAMRLIPKLLIELAATALHLLRAQPDVIVLIDFGAFHIRLARLLRRLGYRKPIVDIFPPSAWLDRENAARAVSAVATPITAFAHQRDFFTSLGLPIAYFGHPLVAQYAPRAAHAIPDDGGTIALLPGSRTAELRYHLRLVIDAFTQLRRSRPQLRAVAGAANAPAREQIARALHAAGLHDVPIVPGIEAAAQADAAFVASGTAVLECALMNVPVVSFYRTSAALEKYARSVYKRPYVTIPNLVLDRPAVPEFLQDDATPQALVRAMDGVLHDPQPQRAAFAQLREALGPPDALAQIARFIVETAGAC